MNSRSRHLLIAGAASALIAVVLGAFGAHALEARLTADLLDIFETANRYHFYHSFALLAVGLLASHVDGKLVAASGWCFLAGIVIFSGSLYLLAVTGLRALGAITPIGGVLFILGWATCAAAVLGSRSPE